MSRSLRGAIIVGLVAGVGILALLRGFVGSVYRVSSPSMAPALLTGDWVLGEKLASWSEPLERGDVVAFHRSDSGEAMVKRVIGLGGDTISLRAGHVFVNEIALFSVQVGMASFDRYGEEWRKSIELPERIIAQERWHERSWKVARLRDPEGILQDGTWTVPAGSVFLLGDNRDASVDSRDPAVGFVPVSAVISRVVRVVASSGPAGMRQRYWLAVP